MNRCFLLAMALALFGPSACGPARHELAAPQFEGTRPTEQLCVARRGHTAHRLSTGAVVLVGGYGGRIRLSDGRPALVEVSTYELWQPAERRWICGLTMLGPRAALVSVLLDNDTLWIAGGVSIGTAIARPLLLHPTAYQTSTIEPPPLLPLARRDHAATRLPGDVVLLTGGLGTDNMPLDAIELLDVSAAPPRPEPLGAMITARAGHTATALPAGQVLVVGGLVGYGSVTDQVERLSIDPPARAAAPLHHGRAEHTATAMGGTVVVIGGRNDRGDALASVERYDPDTDTWTELAALPVARSHHATVRLDDHRLAVVGGRTNSGQVTGRIDVLDLTTGRWSLAGELAVARMWHTATVLDDGRILVAGGQDDHHDHALDSVELVAIAPP